MSLYLTYLKKYFSSNELQPQKYASQLQNCLLELALV